MNIIGKESLLKSGDASDNVNAGQVDKAGLTLEVIKDEEAFDSVSREWNTLVEESGAHIFQTYEWQRTWWKYYGENSESHILHILLFRQKDRLVGIAPFFVDHFKFNSKILYKSLRLLGSKVMQDKNGEIIGELSYTDYLDMITCPGFEEPVCMALRDHFREEDTFDDIVMEEVPGYSPLLTHLLPLFNHREDKWRTAVEDASVCPVTELPDTWDHFLKELSSNARYQVRRFVKRASDKSEKKIFNINRINNEEEIGPAYERLVNFHQSRWNDRGRPGVFAEERMYNFYKEIIFLSHKRGWLQFQEVTVPEDGDQCVAIDLMLKYNKTVYLIQRGFDNSSSYAEYSPGKSLLYTVIKQAIEEGLESYDFLRGDEDYKSRASTHVIQNKNITIRKAYRPDIRLFLFYHIMYQLIFIKRRLRFEWTIISTYFKQENLVFAAGSYLSDVYDRIILKFRKLI